MYSVQDIERRRNCGFGTAQRTLLSARDMPARQHLPEMKSDPISKYSVLMSTHVSASSNPYNIQHITYKYRILIMISMARVTSSDGSALTMTNVYINFNTRSTMQPCHNLFLGECAPTKFCFESFVQRPLKYCRCLVMVK